MQVWICTKKKLPYKILKKQKLLIQFLFSSMVTHHCTQVQGMATQVSHASWSVHSVACQTKTR